MNRMSTDTKFDSPTLTAFAPGDLDRVHGFKPDLRQRYLQAIAIQESEAGKGFLRDWIKYTRYCEMPGGEVTHAEWREWIKADGFKAWFYDFPYPRTVSEEDIEGLDHIFWDAVRGNLSDRDGRTMELYAKLTGKVGKVDEDEGKNTKVIAWLRDGDAGIAAWSGAAPDAKD